MADTSEQGGGGKGRPEEQVSEADVARDQASLEASAGAGVVDSGFRPLTRSERRNAWLKESSEQDVELQMWTRVVERLGLEIEIMFQMHGLLVFGVMVSTAHYAKFYIDLNEELHRQRDP